jgi:hypothetical protein
MEKGKSKGKGQMAKGKNVKWQSSNDKSKGKGQKAKMTNDKAQMKKRTGEPAFFTIFFQSEIRNPKSAILRPAAGILA